MAFNSAKLESTRQTPAYVFLNREILHPLQLLWDIESNPSTNDREQKMRDVTRILLNAHNKTKQQYDRGQSVANYAIGDCVLLNSHFQSDKLGKISQKLQHKWIGPFTIICKNELNL